MATVESVVEEEKKSFFGQLWRRWRQSVRRSRSRHLAHVRFRLTREGVHFLGILLFIFAGAVIREISLLILLAGAMIGLIVLQWRFNTSTLVGLQVSRRSQRSTSVGEETEIGVRLRNHKRFLSAWLVQVEDRVLKTEPDRKRTPTKGVVLVDSIRPNGQVSSAYRLQFHERGAYRVGPATVSTRFPLGLGIGYRTINTTADIYVRPRLGELTTSIERLFQLDQHGQSKSSSKSGAEEGEFFGLRPWATGDSKRWIHWRTTARLGELSVRQYEQHQRRQITIILDLYQSLERKRELGTKPDPHCEQAISFVATLAAKTARQGRDRLSIAFAGEKSRAYPTILSPVLVGSLLDDLAVVSPGKEPDLLEAYRSLCIPIQSNSAVLIVSTRSDQTEELEASASDSLTQRLLATARVRWIDVSNGDLEPYFLWT